MGLGTALRLHACRRCTDEIGTAAREYATRVPTWNVGAYYCMASLVIGSRRTPHTVSTVMADHYDMITVISVASPLWVSSTSLLMRQADDPLLRLLDQALRTNCSAGLVNGIKLVLL